MSDWNYSREETKFEQKTGVRRCVIVDVEEKTSSAGNPMIVVTVTPSGSKAKVKAYLVNNEYFNKRMTEFYDSFPSIKEGSFNFLEWIGAIGAANFQPDDRNPEYLKVRWFVSASKAASLPPFEGEAPTQQTVTSLGDNYVPVEDESGLPF